MLLIKSNNCSNVFAIIYRRCVTHLKNELIQIFNYISNVIIIILISISVQLRRPVLLSRIRCRYISEEYTNKIYGTHRYTPLWLVKWILPLVQDPGDCNSNNKHVFITNYNYFFVLFLAFISSSFCYVFNFGKKKNRIILLLAWGCDSIHDIKVSLPGIQLWKWGEKASFTLLKNAALCW